MIRTFALAAAVLAPVSLAAQDLPTAPYLPLATATTGEKCSTATCPAEAGRVDHGLCSSRTLRATLKHSSACGTPQ